MKAATDKVMMLVFIGVIGGSGLYDLDNLTTVSVHVVHLLS